MPPVSLFPTTTAFPDIQAGRLPRYTFRGLLEHSLALRPDDSLHRQAARCLEGSDGFVTSTAAPIASGRSDRVGRVGLAPTGLTLPFHGALL